MWKTDFVLPQFKQGLGKENVIILLFSLAFFIFSSFQAEAAPKQVKVNVTHFPPFYVVERGEIHTGLGIDLLKAMNEVQKDYRFDTIETSPRRRHHFFKEGLYDVSLFDHLSWGWSKDEVDATEVYLKGGERYISLTDNVKTNKYFQEIKTKKIGAILGYHYNFADFESDPDKLAQRFKITLVNNQSQILKLILANRIEVGVITETYLKQHFVENRQDIEKIAVSSYYDQAYNFVGIVRKSGPISASELEGIIQKVMKAPEYKWIAIKYGIDW